MSVWYCIPSKRPPAEAEKCLSKWRERGYKIALWREDGPRLDSAICIAAPYPGYAKAVNHLVKYALDNDPACDWVVTGGDDVYPDPNHTADEIARELSQWRADTFGVMQPTGDRWGEDDPGAKQRWPNAPAQIDRICGSPWLGREWCLRANQGQGPLWPEYHHNWLDEELQNVAIKYGCFWQRRDLCHYHDHCTRHGGKWAPHLLHVSEDYKRMKPLFEARKKMGFPGSDPL